MKNYIKRYMFGMALAVGLASFTFAQSVGGANGTTVTNNSSSQFMNFTVNVYINWWNPSTESYQWDLVPLSRSLSPSASFDYIYQAIAANSYMQSVAASHGVSAESLVWTQNATVPGYSYYTIAMTAPTSANASISVSAWTPSNSGGSGGTTRVFVVAGYTNWGTGAWTPPGPGNYTFYVGLLPSPGYVGNSNDPLVGNMEINYTAYTVTVN